MNNEIKNWTQSFAPSILTVHVEKFINHRLYITGSLVVSIELNKGGVTIDIDKTYDNSFATCSYVGMLLAAPLH